MLRRFGSAASQHRVWSLGSLARRSVAQKPKSKFRQMAAEQTAAADARVATERASNSFWNKIPKNKFTTLIAEYGFALAVYYFIFNESFVLAVTYLLHYDYVPMSEVIDFIAKTGLVDVERLKKGLEAGYTVWGFEITAKFLSNFAIASAFMSLWTFMQLPFCIATLPYIKGGFRSMRRLVGRKA